MGGKGGRDRETGRGGLLSWETTGAIRSSTAQCFLELLQKTNELEEKELEARQVTVEQLRVGDQLAEDLYTATDLLVLTRGPTISTESRVKLSQYFEERPEINQVWIEKDYHDLHLNGKANR